jgi:hypothetical protein
MRSADTSAQIMEVTMDGRVGKHTRDGRRNCQNWVRDQKIIIGLLNRIPISAGGAGGSLATGPLVEGICSDALYKAIVQFEDKHPELGHSGFVDPGGKMLKAMEDLAKAPTPAAPTPAAETKLDILRRNVQNVQSVVGKWTAGDAVQLDKLIKVVLNHIDNLKGIKDQAGKPLDKLPWWAEIFGRAYIFKAGTELIYTYRPNKVVDFRYVAEDLQGRRKDISAEMKSGYPVKWSDAIFVYKLPALVLFQDGLCSRIPPNTVANISALRVAAENGIDPEFVDHFE